MVQLFGGNLLAPYLPSPRALLFLGIAFALAILVCEIYLSVWKVGASLGNRRLGFLASFRIVQGSFWWSFLFYWLIFVPPLILHYLLNAFAIGRPPAATWAILGVDAAMVGYLGIVLIGATYVIACRALGQKGETLLA